MSMWDMRAKWQMISFALLIATGGPLLISGCVESGSPAATPIPAVSPTAGTATPAPGAPSELATPYSSEPAAGICAGPEVGDTAVVEIWPDVPSPRCLKVRPEQQLKVVNRTGEIVEIVLGPYTAQIQAEQDHTLQVSLGSYLAPGVHLLLVTPYGGPELWLEE